MTRIAIIVGSTRPGRKAATVAAWVHRIAAARSDASYEIVDLAEVDLPRYNETVPPIVGHYQQAHTRRWAAQIASYDGFVFVTPEYNRSVPAALKDAIDYLYAEWHHTAAGFVSYGVLGGIRAVEHLRQVAGELKIADVRAQVALNLADITDTDVTASDQQHTQLTTMLDEVVAWAEALRPLRHPTQTSLRAS